MRKNLDLNKPSQTEVEKYLKLWDSLENYTLCDRGRFFL
jgi:hypothetical protein